MGWKPDHPDYNNTLFRGGKKYMFMSCKLIRAVDGLVVI